MGCQQQYCCIGFLPNFDSWGGRTLFLISRRINRVPSRWFAQFPPHTSSTNFASNTCSGCKEESRRNPRQKAVVRVPPPENARRTSIENLLYSGVSVLVLFNVRSSVFHQRNHDCVFCLSLWTEGVSEAAACCEGNFCSIILLAQPHTFSLKTAPTRQAKNNTYALGS